jgi:GTPase SAR1 family protein
MIETKIESQLRIKIVLVGDVSTGKTNIKNRFCRGTFREFSNPTVGVQLASRNFWSTF